MSTLLLQYASDMHGVFPGLMLIATVVLYLLATLMALPGVFRAAPSGGSRAPLLAGAGLVVHLGSLLHQGLVVGRSPLLDRYATMSLVAWLIVLIYLVVWSRGRMQIFSVLLPALALIVLVTSNLLEVVLPPPPVMPGSAESTSLLAIHVSIAALGVAALFLTFASSLTFLFQDRILKSKQVAMVRALPSLDACDRLVMRSLLWGFPLLTLTIVTGSVLNAMRTGHYWTWRLDQTFAVVAWTIFAVILWARQSRGWRGRKSAYLTIAGVVAGVLTLGGMYLR